MTNTKPIPEHLPVQMTFKLWTGEVIEIPNRPPFDPRFFWERVTARMCDLLLETQCGPVRAHMAGLYEFAHTPKYRSGLFGILIFSDHLKRIGVPDTELERFRLVNLLSVLRLGIEAKATYSHGAPMLGSLISGVDALVFAQGDQRAEREPAGCGFHLFSSVCEGED